MDPHEAEAWHEIGDVFWAAYDANASRKRAAATRLALKLARLLAKYDADEVAMIGMAGRALIAELDGDYPEAIRYRLKELETLKLLQSDLPAASQKHFGVGPADYSDRLDLLALTYLEAGMFAEAEATIRESETYCKEHGIRFDGRDVAADIRRAVRAARPKRARAKVAPSAARAKRRPAS